MAIFQSKGICLAIIFSYAMISQGFTENSATISLDQQEEIKSFSSYTEGLHPVIRLFSDSGTVDLTLLLPQEFQQKIQEKMVTFSTSSIISLNGVSAQIKEIKLKEHENSQIQVIASIAKQAFANSSLNHIQPGNKVMLGMISADPDKWLLSGEPIGSVILKNAEIAKGHRYLEEFTFECSQHQYDQIRHLKYIGLNGSGFMIQHTEESNQHYYFSVHAGRVTREKSLFSRDKIAIGTECTLTLPSLN